MSYEELLKELYELYNERLRAMTGPKLNHRHGS